MLLVAARAFAQSAAPIEPPAPSAAPPATLIYGNRPIVALRASILARTPAERVAAAQSRLDTIVAGDPPGPVMTRLVEGVMIVAVGDENVLAIVPADVDELAGETLGQKANVTVARLQIAVNEQVELRTPGRLAWSAAQSLIATIAFVALLLALRRGYLVMAVRLPEGAERQLERISVADRQLVRASRAGDILRRFISLGTGLLALFLTYSWLTFVLRRFPYTRPWGESLREFLLTRLASMGLAIARSIPDLFTVFLIVLITRFIARLVFVLFEAAEQERVKLPMIYPETAQPTRRLVTALLWLCALVASYPYLPGSDSDAFKGASVFVGLIVSLGSSGIVNQMMSGFTITYSRALRLGDFVAIGDVEGTVTHLGSLATKIKTLLREDITIPNAVVVSTPITNYSRFADGEGVFVPTTVTIGYDVPWRQIHALLLMAAKETPDIRQSPAPVVRQTALQDFSVKYTLFVCVEHPHVRSVTLGALRANIQDAFNEFGVQIMAPNYEADPNAPKVVPREKWYAAPAAPPAPESPDSHHSLPLRSQSVESG